MVTQLLFASILCASGAEEQGSVLAEAGRRTIAISGTLQLHAYAFPFQVPAPAPLHPAQTLGVERTWTSWGPLEVVQLAELGAYDSRDLVRAAFLQTHTALRVVAQVGALAEVSLGGGYLHRWHRRQSFTLDESKGTWEARPHPGSPSAMFGFGLGAGWRFSEVAGRPRPFVRYQFFGHTPYAEFAPLMAHSLLGLGLAVEL